MVEGNDDRLFCLEMPRPDNALIGAERHLTSNPRATSPGSCGERLLPVPSVLGRYRRSGLSCPCSTAVGCSRRSCSSTVPQEGGIKTYHLNKACQVCCEPAKLETTFLQKVWNSNRTDCKGKKANLLQSGGRVDNAASKHQARSLPVLCSPTSTTIAKS